MKVAINKTFCCFAVSSIAAKMLKDKGVAVTLAGEYFGDGSGPSRYDTPHYLHEFDFYGRGEMGKRYRGDKRLIEVIEYLGCSLASGDDCVIELVEVDDNAEWFISEAAWWFDDNPRDFEILFQYYKN